MAEVSRSSEWLSFFNACGALLQRLHDLIVLACAPSLGVGLAVLLGSTSSYLSWKQEDDAREKRVAERTTSAVEGRHAFGRADAPKGLSGMTLWRDTMQSCGFNLSEVVADFYTLLEQAAVRHKQFIVELPRLQSAMEIVGDQVVIRAVRSGTGNIDDLHCRVRQSADADPQFDLHFRSYDKDQFRVPKSKLPGRSFWYQLGVKHTSVPHIIYEPWVEAPLP